MNISERSLGVQCRHWKGASEDMGKSERRWLKYPENVGSLKGLQEVLV